MRKESEQYSVTRFRSTVLFSALAPSTILFLAYFTVSLLDLWQFGPKVMQSIAYILSIVLGFTFLILAAVGKFTLSFRRMVPRLMIGVFVAIGAVFISGEDFERLSTLSLKPRPLFEYPEPTVVAFLTPPLYLGKETVTQNMISHGEGAKGINPIYEGSILDVRVEGTDWAPSINLSDGTEIKFDELKDGSFKVSAKINQQVSWSIDQGSYQLGHWPITLIDDEKPKIIEFSLQEHENEKGYIALRVRVADDRKIMNAAIEVIDNAGNSSDKKELSIREIKSYKSTFYVDLTGSELAGQEVALKLSVEDEAGQNSVSVLDKVEVPNKDYHSPIAHKLNALREELISADYDLNSLSRQMKALGLLSDDEGLPPIYYMALRSAYWRLTDPANENDFASARDMLWDIAEGIEDGGLSSIENDLIYSLDELSLSINQNQSVQNIRIYLRETDRLFRDYISVSNQTFSKRYSLEIDLNALRKLYSYILTFSDQEKFYNAALIVDFIRKGLTQNDDLILSEGGLGNYFALSESRQIIDNLIAIQKTLLASSYNDQMLRNVVNQSPAKKKNERTIKAKNNQIMLQTKVGAAVKLLGKKMSFTGDSSGFLIENASALVDEIIANMKKSELSQVTQSQSELIAIMSNLKRVLNKPISSAPELKDILQEINAKPVS